ALEALSLQVRANGKHWEASGAIPLTERAQKTNRGDGRAARRREDAAGAGDAHDPARYDDGRVPRGHEDIQRGRDAARGHASDTTAAVPGASSHHLARRTRGRWPAAAPGRNYT